MEVSVQMPLLGFSTILMDVPWNETGGGGRGAQNHYPLIKTKAGILQTIYQSGVWQPAKNAHLYFWVTNTFLPLGLEVISDLGFDYKTNWPWVKKGTAGVGQYGRGKHELLLFAVRGKGYAVRTESRKIDTAFLVGAESPIDPKTGKRKHSAKPPGQYDLIHARTACPAGTGRLEMFCRSPRSGWFAWGNEVSSTGISTVVQHNAVESGHPRRDS